MTYTLVILRHGESIWNAKNKFTGWTDVELSLKGIKEAQHAGKILKQKGYTFDAVYTSYLKRSIRTTWIVLDEMDLMWIPIELAWQLNERHYGALQGLNKKETARKFGEDQVHAWRRSYSTRPPALTPDDPRYPGHDARYSKLKKSEIPLTECLKDTVERVLPYWKKHIVPDIKKGKKVFLSIHGNSIRALIKHLENLPEDEIINLNIPTGIPLIYELDEKMRPIKHFYLADEKKLKAALTAVESQSKIKSFK